MIICALEAFGSAVLLLAFRTRAMIECVEPVARTHTHTYVRLAWSLLILSAINMFGQCRYQWLIFLRWFNAIQSEKPAAPSLLLFIVSLFLLPSHQIFSSLLVFLSSLPDLSSGPLRSSINMLLASSCEVLNIQRTFSNLLYLSGFLACF